MTIDRRTPHTTPPRRPMRSAAATLARHWPGMPDSLCPPAARAAAEPINATSQHATRRPCGTQDQERSSPLLHLHRSGAERNPACAGARA